MIRSFVPSPSFAATALLLFATFGCGGGGDDLPREPVYGTVALDGAPLARGSIQFRPAATGPGPSVISGASIEGGRFSLPRSEGLLPGHYRVLIFAGGAETPPEDIGGTAPPPVKELIPARYNAESTLTAEIKANGPNSLAFDLKN